MRDHLAAERAVDATREIYSGTCTINTFGPAEHVGDVATMPFAARRHSPPGSRSGTGHKTMAEDQGLRRVVIDGREYPHEKLDSAGEHVANGSRPVRRRVRASMQDGRSAPRTAKTRGRSRHDARVKQLTGIAGVSWNR